MALMDAMVKSIKKEKREEMMVDMMPQMMEGIDMNELMPKMMANMLKDLNADDIIEFIRKMFDDNDKLSGIGQKVAEANLMSKMMMKTWKSKYSFDETVQHLLENAPKNSWHIPDTRDITKLWNEQGIEDAPAIVTLYFCNARGGDTITRQDDLKAMSVMMPMGVSVYKTSNGDIEVAAMNIGMMSGMFAGEVKATLSKSAENLENCMKGLT